MQDRQPGGQQNGGSGASNQKKSQGPGSTQQAQRQASNRQMQQVPEKNQGTARRDKQTDKAMPQHPGHPINVQQSNAQAVNLRPPNHPGFGPGQQQNIQQQLQGVATDAVMNPAQAVYGPHAQANRVSAGQMQHMQGVMPGARPNGSNVMMDPQQMVQAHGANQVAAGHYAGIVGQAAGVPGPGGAGHRPGHVPPIQPNQGPKNRKQAQEQDHANCMRIQEELSSLCHLDNLVGNHSNLISLYKKIQRAQARSKDHLKNMPGNREVRKPEPLAEMAHQDFLIKEMQDMAQDFMEETYSKRYLLAKLAYEAQQAALNRMKLKAAEDKGSAIQIITGPGKSNPNLKSAAPFDSHNNQDDILVGPPVSQPPAQLGVFADQVLARQTTDPLGDDILAMPRPQPIQSPGGSLDSLLGSPGAPQQPRDLDLLSNHEAGDGTQDQQRPQDQRDQNNNDFGGNGPNDMMAQNINTDLDNLYNPRAVNSIPMNQDNVRVDLPQESAFANEVEFQKQSVAAKGDVLMSNTDILKDMGDIEKRNQEFNQLMEETAVDQKFLFYKDTRDALQEEENQMIMEPDPDLVKLNQEMRNKERQALQQSRLFSNKVVNLVNQYYEEKYVDLEGRKARVEYDYEKAQMQKYQSLDYTNQLEIEDLQERNDEKQNDLFDKKADNQKRVDQAQDYRAQSQINVDSLLNNRPNNQANNANQIGNLDQPQPIQPSSYNDPNRVNYNQNGPSMGHVGYNGFMGPQSRDNILGSYAPGLNDMRTAAGPSGVYSNNNVDLGTSLGAPVASDQARANQTVNGLQQPQTRDAQTYHTEDVQVEVLFQQDIFQMWEDRQEEMATRSNTVLQSHDESMAVDGQALDMHQQQSALDRHNDTNMEDSDGSLDLEDAFKNELKPENANAKILPQVYRFGQDFLQDVCNQMDRELIRCFPNLTDPEHTMLLLDIFTRRKHLDCQAKQIEKIAQTNRELIRTERMNEPGTELKIEALKNEIKNQEQKLWALHKEAYQQRVQQAQEFSQKFKNVYHHSSQTIRDLKKSIHNQNQRNSQQKPLQLFNDSEVAFMRWYVSIFGDNWRLIAHVLNYHPFTRGYLRTKESLSDQFIHYMNVATHSTLLNDQIQLKPWRTTGQPLLITERPPSLYCSIKQINQMHHTKIKSLDLQRLQPNKIKVIRVVQQPDGKKLEFVKWEHVDQQTKQLIGNKRAAPDDNNMGEAQLIQSQDAFHTMIKNEYEGDSYIHKFYLGQKIDEILRGDLKRPPPNFGFQSCHNRRKSCSRLRPMSTCQKRQRPNQFEEQKQPSYPPFGAGKMGAGKSSSLIQSQGMLNSGRMQLQQNEKSQQGLEITPEEMNTPMFCALHENKSNNGSKSVYVKSVSHQAGIMFWLGYLYKKIAQSKMEQKVRIINDSGTEEQRKYEKQLPQQIASQHIREARRIRQREEFRRNRNPDQRWQRTPQELQEIKNQETLQEELRVYKPEVIVGLRRQRDPAVRLPPVELVNHLWDNELSIFHFDSNNLEQYLDSDHANMRGERKLDAIIDTMETKWDRMDRYWFQKNRHLDQKMRKKKDSPNYPPRSQSAWPPGAENTSAATAGPSAATNPNMPSGAPQMVLPGNADGMLARQHDQDHNAAQNVEQQAHGPEGNSLAQGGHYMPNLQGPREQALQQAMQQPERHPAVNQGQVPFDGVAQAAGQMQPQDHAAQQPQPIQPSRNGRAGAQSRREQS